MAKRRGNSEGTIYQRKDGRWEARITTAVTLDGTAKRRCVYGATRQEVATKLRELLERQANGTLVDVDRITVKHWLDRWLDGKRHLTPKSVAVYRHSLSILNRHIGSVPVQKVRPLNVRDTFTAIAAEGYAPRTQRHCAMALRAALNEAVDVQLIPNNPALPIKVKAPRVESKADAWDASEVALFLRAAKGELARQATGGAKAKGRKAEVVAVGESVPHWHYPAFYLMLTLGLRRGEVLGLMWDDIDFEAAVLTVRRSLSETGQGGSFALKEVKTVASRRRLYVPRDALAVLAEHRQRVLSLFDACPALVFVSATGTPVDPNNLGRAFNTLCNVAGVRHVRLHDLRHTYASLALRRGIPAEIVSEKLGHANVGFTLSVYRHLYDVERREATLSLDELLTGRARVVN